MAADRDGPSSFASSDTEEVTRGCAGMLMKDRRRMVCWFLAASRQIEVALPASAALLRGSSSPRRARSPIVPVAALCFVPSCGMEASSQYQEIAVHRARPQEHLRLK
ncbi:hypothetical protein PVAP13_1KG270205 [Panicum virgatum]|uniref:Uncharacterized protein n=1 Tax=Panicum virgatum TaxID=38727 RepID=A0A8T0XHS0_PANVG|nr:hypothetical protein PVAP13_1KG270205 [Panicum virgatum]